MKNIFLLVSLILAIKFGLSAQCLVQPVCPASPQSICDYTENDLYLWNDAFFNDPILNSHDLGEGPADFSISMEDSCGTGGLHISYTLLLDLDGDGQSETAIFSDSLPGNGLVNYGNALNPNYSGGTPVKFDNRPIPLNSRYAFALKTTIQGNVTTASIRWNTLQQPASFVMPQIPAGTHHILWRFEKDGEVDTCGYNFVIKDCKAPVAVCINGISANIPPTQQLQLTTLDFLQYALDNYTPASQLVFGIRRSNTGTGFPVNGFGQPITSVNFTCIDLGYQPVEIWARDKAGNAEYCETYVTVQDNGFSCQPVDATIDVCAKYHCDGAPIPGVHFDLATTSAVFPTATYDLGVSGTNGCASTFTAPIPENSVVTITPTKDGDPLDGVNTLDLLLISRHILGLEPLSSPYKMVAADANRSGSITTFDISELQKLILGEYSVLPNNTVWRFVDSTFVFPNPNNPFPQTGVGQPIDTVQPYLSKLFYGIKIGDVNCSYTQSLTANPIEYLSMPDLSLQAGDTAVVPIRLLYPAGHQYEGFQIGLQFDTSKVQVLSVIPKINISPLNSGIHSGHVNTSYVSNPVTQPHISFPQDKSVYSLRIKALTSLHLAEVFSMDTTGLHGEAYLTNDSTERLRLQFSTVVGTQEPQRSAQIFAPQPNPTSAGLRFPLYLEQSENVQVEISDAMGRLIYRQQQSGTPGAQSLELPATAFPQTGVYFWRVQAGTAFATGKIVKQ